MAAGRLFLPGWMPALDNNGAPIPAASAYFYLNETDALASIYADDTLSVPLSNPVFANSSGRFPTIWASDAVTYSYSISAPYGPAGIPFTGDGLSVSQGVAIMVADAADAAADEAAANAAQTAADLAEIQAIEAAGSTAPAIAGKLNRNGDNAQAGLLAAIGAVASADLADDTGAELVGVIASGTGAVARTQQAKNRDIVSVTDFGAGQGGDDYAKIVAALASVDTAGGKGGSVYWPAGVYSTSQKIVVPDRVRLVGSGSRSCILNAAFNGVMLEFDSTTNSGLEGFRLGLGSGAAAVGIDIKTTLGASARFHRFSDLEIAGGAVAGQIGIRMVATAGQIIAENVFNEIVTFQVDKPLIDTDTEGNFWTACSADTWGYSVTSALLCQGLANQYQWRLAGNPLAGSVGYTQTGAGNIADIVADIGVDALSISADSRNIVRIQRPEGLTPLGTVGRGNVIMDRDTLIADRVMSRGVAATSGQFALTSEWGNAATVTDVVGDDGCVRFTVNSAGTGQAAFPYVTFTFNKPFPYTPMIQSVQRSGGSQFTVVEYFGLSETTTTWQFRWAGTPVDGESYLFTVKVG